MAALQQGVRQRENPPFFAVGAGETSVHTHGLRVRARLVICSFGGGGIVMIKFELDPSEAQFLKEQIGRQLDRMQNELVHTDDRALHRDLAHDIERLTRVREQMFRPS
jgi:hypothetical protein